MQLKLIVNLIKNYVNKNYFVYCLLLFFLAFLVNLTNSLLMLHSYFNFFVFLTFFQWYFNCKSVVKITYLAVKSTISTGKVH